MDTAALWAQVVRGGRRDFLVTPDLRMSFADLGEAIGRWLAWFDAHGILAGDRVLIRTANEAAAITGFIAGLLDGVVPIVVTPDTPDTRLLSLVAVVEPAGLACDAGKQPRPDVVPTLLLDHSAAPAARKWFGARKRRDITPGLPAATVRQPRLPRDGAGLAYILFTSGTTSEPTGVQVTRGNLFANLATQTRVFGYDNRSRIFNDMILAHADGMIQGPIQALVAGCAVIRSGGFSLPVIESWLGRVRAERATHVITVPTVWAMIDQYARHDDYFDAPECGALLSVAAKLPDDLWRRLETRFARPVFNQYGLTETVVTALWAGRHREMGGFGTIGKPIDGEAGIDHAMIDQDWPDGAGELLLRGAHVFPGYWRDEARTRATFTGDGWLRTGDIARCRPDGSYEILGRIKTVIMMGGFLIRPDEIDEALMRHDAVCESITIGVEDAIFGELPVSAVVLADPSALVSESDLTTHARAFLESQKVPKRIFVLPEIPRGVSGKPRLDALHDLLGRLLGQSGANATGTEQSETGDAGVRRDQVIAVAADTFRVDPAMLDLTSGPGSVAGWDSFSQLNFLMAIEQRFAIAIPAARVARIATIGDMLRTVEDLRR